jgi:hypothetical protein
MYAPQSYGRPPSDRDSELAAELLDVVNPAELEAFLGGLVAEAAGPVAGAARDRLVDRLRDTARRTLPALATALPSAPADVLTARRAARVFGVELEGVSAEDRDYEIARQFVRFARAAARTV